MRDFTGGAIRFLLFIPLNIKQASVTSKCLVNASLLSLVILIYLHKLEDIKASRNLS